MERCAESVIQHMSDSYNALHNSIKEKLKIVISAATNVTPCSNTSSSKRPRLDPSVQSTSNSSPDVSVSCLVDKSFICDFIVITTFVDTCWIQTT